MLKWLSAILAGTLLTLPLQTSQAAGPKAGTICNKLYQKQTYAGKRYICIRSGRKLVWDKGVNLYSPSPSPSSSSELSPSPLSTLPPVAVTVTFDNLIQNEKNISFTAWEKASKVILASSAKNAPVNIFTGPKTTPLFEETSLPVSLVSRLFPNNEEAKTVIWIRYGYDDIAWAESLVKEKLSSSDFEQITRNQGGALAPSNCESSLKICRGSYQQTGPSGTALIMQGVPSVSGPYSPSSDPNFITGQLEAHEYLHSLQRIPMLNKNLPRWAPAWWREGSADWVKFASVNYLDYTVYKKSLMDSCASDCIKLSEADINEMLSTVNGESLAPKFSSFLNYTIGSQVIEKLVSIKGPSIIIDLYVEMGKGQSFEDAFNTVMNEKWADAIPILSQSVFDNLHPSS